MKVKVKYGGAIRTKMALDRIRCGIRSYSTCHSFVPLCHLFVPLCHSLVPQCHSLVLDMPFVRTSMPFVGTRHAIRSYLNAIRWYTTCHSFVPQCHSLVPQSFIIEMRTSTFLRTLFRFTRRPCTETMPILAGHLLYTWHDVEHIWEAHAWGIFSFGKINMANTNFSQSDPARDIVATFCSVQQLCLELS